MSTPKSLAVIALILFIAPAAGAQTWGTYAEATTHSYAGWYWGNYNDTHNCFFPDPVPCGAGPQSSTSNAWTPSDASATPGLGHSVVSSDATGGSGGTGGLSPNIWSGNATGFAEWWDTFTITSNTLPVGTLVNVYLAIAFDGVGGGNDSWFSRAQFAYGGPNGGLYEVRLGYEGAPGNSLSGVFRDVIQQSVGETFTLYGLLESHSETVGGADESSSSDARADWYVDIGDGAVLSTASGHAYSTPPVTSSPEPSTWVLTATGLGLAAAVGRRRVAFLDQATRD